MLIEQRPAEDPPFLEVLDRVLDRGIVVDAALRISVTGVEVVTIDIRLVVASIETFLDHADPLARASRLAPSMGSASRVRVHGH